MKSRALVIFLLTAFAFLTAVCIDQNATIKRQRFLIIKMFNECNYAPVKP